MKNVSLLIKPVSGLCNLKCEYCFYKDVLSKKEFHNQQKMSVDLIENLIDQAIQMASDRVQLAFQGGEPMLAGIEFYNKVVEIIKRKSVPEINIELSIQTNGTLITREWAEFFKGNNFLVGISLDGTEKLHNTYRKKYSTEGTFQQVISGIKQLQEINATFNTLSVVTAPMSSMAAEVYEELKALGVRYMQFIPCIEPLGAYGGHDFSLNNEDYARFMCELFDRWYFDYINRQYISIRAFDDFVHLLAGDSPGACAASGNCGRYMVIESDGSAYPCDFFATDEYYIGRFGDQSLDGLYKALLKSDFVNCLVANSECRECLFYRACRGGCRRDYIRNTGQPRNRFCNAYKEFFIYAYPKLLKIAANERNYLKNNRRGE